jgi:2-dehydro-3-deoxyglucarate aldolase/4-hydroxy-2-oxoheptanedioate aldolase
MRIGFWLETATQAACEIAARQGFDIVLYDMEHGVIDAGDLDRLVPLCRGLGLETYVRVAAAERAAVQQALDTGADGVLLPQLRDAQHAREASDYAKFPPLGSRGMGFGRIHGYAGMVDDFAETENRRTRCYAMIETPRALEEAQAIAALPTVDGLFVGPGDLSLSRGRGPNRWTRADLEDLRGVAAAASRAGKLFATAGGDKPAGKAFGEEVGAAFLTAGDDLSALLIGFRALIESARTVRP